MTVNEAMNDIRRFTRQSVDLGLDRIQTFLDRAGNPQKSLRFVHIAGTNGKGSTAAMIAQVLTEAGYQTGLFTSPALSALNEQFRVNGIPADDDALTEIITDLRPHAEALPEPLTEFEFVTMIAFEYFRRCRCELVVLETGLGGRLDATNVIDAPEAAVITSIGLDHRKELGDTIEEIASEKAGIIKKNTDVVLYQQTPAVAAVIEKVCREKNARLHNTDFSQIHPVSVSLEEQQFDLPGLPRLFMPLLGEHQRNNALTAIETIAVLRDQGFVIPDSAVYRGLRNVRWPARFEILRRAPAVILDGGHNPQGMRALAESLNNCFPDKKIKFILGLFADKEYPAMMDIIAPAADCFYTVTSDNPRALPSETLAGYLKKFSVPVHVCDTVEHGLTQALGASGKEDVLCVAGSFSLAGAARAFFGRH